MLLKFKIIGTRVGEIMRLKNDINFSERVCTSQNDPKIYFEIRGAFNNFPDFFLQAFKIV